MPTTNNKVSRLHCWLLATMLAVVTLSLGGCGGGMVGTGTGPRDDAIAYQVESLPERINPDIPRPLLDSATLNGQQIGASDSGIKSRERNVRMNEDGTAESWQILNRNVSEVLLLSLEATEIITLIDAVYPEVLSRCDTRIGETCRIEEGILGGEYSTALIARLQQIYSAPLNSLVDSGSGLGATQSDYFVALESRIGTRFEFRAFDYRALNGEPFDHQVTTSVQGLFRGRSLTVRWNNERTVSTVVILSQIGEILNIRTIGFDVNLPGERLTYTEDSQVGSELSSRFYVTILASTEPDRRVLLESRLASRVGDIFGNTAIQGQINDSGGYTRLQKYTNIDNAIRGVSVLHEAFDQAGILNAAEQCRSGSVLTQCETAANFSNTGPAGSMVESSPQYFSSDNFESLKIQQDTIQWQTSKLPSDVVDFQVVAADAGVTLAGQQVLCDGIQFAPGKIQLFCTAPDETLGSSAIVTIDDSGIRQLIGEAMLVPK